MLNRNKYTEKGWIYTGHKDECVSMDFNEFVGGEYVYISIYEDLEVEAYDGKVGNPSDFREKMYVEYEWFGGMPPVGEAGHTSESFFRNSDGELEQCEKMWVRITAILSDVMDAGE